MSTPKKSSKKPWQPWEILKTERVLNERWKKVDKQIVRLPDGSTKDWFVTLMSPIAAVFAITKDNKIIVNRQYKHGARDIIYELPIGLVEDGENPAAAARRELMEETGYRVSALRKIVQYYYSPTGTSGVVHLYLGTDGVKIAEPENNPSEQIDVILLTPSQLVEWVKRGKINSQGAIAAAMLGLLSIKKLRA